MEKKRGERKDKGGGGRKEEKREGEQRRKKKGGETKHEGTIVQIIKMQDNNYNARQ